MAHLKPSGHGSASCTREIYADDNVFGYITVCISATGCDARRPLNCYLNIQFFGYFKHESDGELDRGTCNTVIARDYQQKRVMAIVSFNSRFLNRFTKKVLRYERLIWKYLCRPFIISCSVRDIDFHNCSDIVCKNIFLVILCKTGFSYRFRFFDFFKISCVYQEMFLPFYA